MSNLCSALLRPLLCFGPALLALSTLLAQVRPPTPPEQPEAPVVLAQFEVRLGPQSQGVHCSIEYRIERITPLPHRYERLQGERED